jgi:hypothetical protein
MRLLHVVLRFVPAVVVIGCSTTTECDCVAPTVVVAGNVVGVSPPVRVEARLAQSPCPTDASASGSVNIGEVQNDGTYRVGIPLPAPGPACVVVTATKFANQPITVTRRVEATITKMPANGPQEVRVDVAFPTS